jgi:hypothetical protein
MLSFHILSSSVALGWQLAVSGQSHWNYVENTAVVMSTISHGIYVLYDTISLFMKEVRYSTVAHGVLLLAYRSTSAQQPILHLGSYWLWYLLKWIVLCCIFIDDCCDSYTLMMECKLEYVICYFCVPTENAIWSYWYLKQSRLQHYFFFEYLWHQEQRVTWKVHWSLIN